MGKIFDLVKLKKDLYFLDYPYDYYLDELLARGIDGIGGLLKFVVKKNHLKGRLGLNPKGTGCTTVFAQNTKGDYILGRNFDYIPAPTLILRTHPKNGYKSLSTVDMNMMLYGKKTLNPEKANQRRLFLAPHTAVDGINEKGLCIAVLEVNAQGTKQSRGKPSVLASTIVRAVLDKCATCHQAVRLISRYDFQAFKHYDYHFHLVDKKGKSIVIEYINNKMKVIYNQPYAMNFYLRKGGKPINEMGRTREKIVKSELAKSQGQMNENSMMKLLRACKLDYRHKHGYKIVTNWSNVFNCTEKTVQICNNMDYTSKFKISLK